MKIMNYYSSFLALIVGPLILINKNDGQVVLFSSFLLIIFDLLLISTQSLFARV